MDVDSQAPLRFTLLPALYKSEVSNAENCKGSANRAGRTLSADGSRCKASQYKFPFRMAEQGSIRDLQAAPDPSKTFSLLQSTFKKFSKKRKQSEIPSATTKAKRRRKDNRAKVVAEWRLKRLIDFQREENNNTKTFLSNLKKSKRKSRVSRVQFAAKQEIQRKAATAKETEAPGKDSDTNTGSRQSSGDSWYALMLQKLQAQE